MSRGRLGANSKSAEGLFRTTIEDLVGIENLGRSSGKAWDSSSDDKGSDDDDGETASCSTCHNTVGRQKILATDESFHHGLRCMGAVLVHVE